MKGFIELTDSLDRRCTIKVSSITRISERTTYRIEELMDRPELGEKDSEGEWKHNLVTTCVEAICPCDNLYAKESYEEVLKMMEDALCEVVK